MNLSFRQLHTFREVIRSGSISGAARTLGRTQPAVSSMIAGLEDELGFALFLREHGKLTPTPEARFFLEECEEILDRLDQTKRTLGGIGNLSAGRLRIACHPAASGFFMPMVLTDFLRDKPGIEVSLMMRSSTVIEDLIASQQFDVGFAEAPIPRASIKQQDFDMECVCALPAGDPLAARDAITARDLDGGALATLFAEHTTYGQTCRAFEATDCTFQRRFELQTFLPGLRFVEAGLCSMICDMITAHTHLKSNSAGTIRFRRFAPAITSKVSILTPAHSPQSVIAAAFCAHLAGHVAALQADMQAGLGAISEIDGSR